MWASIRSFFAPPMTADPAEVAAAILHLAGPENSYIAGETLLVAGGYVMD